MRSLHALRLVEMTKNMCKQFSVNPNALMHRFYGAIEFEGKTYRVMTLMREDKSPSNSDGPYAYEVQKIEVPNEETSSTANGVGSNKPEGVSYPLAKLLNNVEKSKDSGKYLLDESKKTKEKASITSLNTPSDVKGEGAVSPDASLSGDKDTKNINTLQENEQKSSAEASRTAALLYRTYPRQSCFQLNHANLLH